MPHHKNRLKLTGDTHLPDVGLDYRLDDDEAEIIAVPEPRVFADGYEPPAAQEMTEPQPPTTVQKVEREVAQQTRRTPWLAVGGALAFGFLVAKMMRR
jgi:hypothetical protein